ncbi:RutC family protein, partial [Pseudolycoriella hygida]
MERKLYSSGTKWELTAGYSRAIRVGNVIEVAGTVAVDESNEVVGKDDVYMQTKYILQKIQKALKEAGSDLNDIVRTRMYTTDISKFDDITRAHGEFFKDIRPVCTLIEVSRLVQPDLLVEIEASAIVT